MNETKIVKPDFQLVDLNYVYIIYFSDKSFESHFIQLIIILLFGLINLNLTKINNCLEWSIVE